MRNSSAKAPGPRYFLALNRNKRSLRLNLKDERGREVLLRLVEDYDVVVESFRPGVMDRLGVGYEALRERNPRLIYCPISGYGQDGPLTARSGHDTNYLALNGLLGLTGRRGGPPVQSAGQIADLGGGGLMAAVGILAAVIERERSGEGQLVDISMTDGALSWLAMVVARYFAEQTVPRRGEIELAGGIACYFPYETSDGKWVSLGALEPKFWQNWCAGVERPDLVEKQFEHPDSDAGAQVAAVFRERTRDEWAQFASEHDCCLEPILDLDEALESDLVPARGMVVELDQPGIGPVKQVGSPLKLSRTPPDTTGAHRPSGRTPTRCWRRPVTTPRRSPACGRTECMVSAPPRELLRISELADAAGVSAGTIKHYLREGLLPEPVKTSRNMAWYPREWVERVKLIKQLQEERFLPLKVIREVLEQGGNGGGPEQLRAMIDLEDRILERALGGRGTKGMSAKAVQERYGVPREALERLESLEVLTPRVRNGAKRYGPDDVQIIEAIGRMRASGYSEALGFTVYDTLIYKRNLERMVHEEVETMMQRVAGELDTGAAADLVEQSVEPMQDLVAAMRAKLLVAELQARRAAQM